MILADTNFWVALALSKHTFHQAARLWFHQQTAKESVLFCRSTQQSFLRLLSTDSMMRPYDLPAMENQAAWDVYEGFRADRRIGFVQESAGVEQRWKKFTERRSASPKLWMDAYLAAFAVAGEHQLVTTDGAFRQFKGLDAIFLPHAKANP